MATHDVETGQNTNGRITGVLTGVATELVHITIRNETLTCTPEHPFWVADRGWVVAGELGATDHLMNAAGKRVPILRISHESLARPIPVYNISVGGQETFYVGENRILVHNKSC